MEKANNTGRGLFFHLFFPLFYTIVIGLARLILASSSSSFISALHRIVIPELLPDLYGLVIGLLSPAALNTMLLKIALPTIISLLSSADAFVNVQSPVPRSGLRTPPASADQIEERATGR